MAVSWWRFLTEGATVAPVYVSLIVSKRWVVRVWRAGMTGRERGVTFGDFKPAENCVLGSDSGEIDGHRVKTKGFPYTHV